MNSLRQLLWKDLRIARAYLIVAGAALVAPYGFLAYARLASARGTEWDQTLHFTGMAAGLAVIIIASLLAGAGLATERTDRSTEFLAYLPLTRRMRLVSKLAVVAVPVLALWLANPLIVLDILPHGWPQADSPNAAILLTLTISTLLAVGVGWLGSSLASPAAALLLGLLAPFFLTCLYFLGVVVVERLFDTHVDLDDWFAPIYRWSALAFGAVSLMIGSRVYLSRPAD